MAKECCETNDDGLPKCDGTCLIDDFDSDLEPIAALGDKIKNAKAQLEADERELRRLCKAFEAKHFPNDRRMSLGVYTG
jgi:hypothetical protein